MTTLPRTRSLLALVTAGLLAAPAAAITINIEYDDSPADAVDCCAGEWACCEKGEDRVAELTLLVAAAAATWEDIIEDDVTVRIRFWFTSEKDPEGTSTETDALGRPTAGWIRFPAHRNWFYDGDPFDHSEYDLTPKLYGNTHPVEQAEAFLGAPPEVLEVGFNGPESPPRGGIDLFTVVLHEMGHALGLNNFVLGGFRVPPCQETGGSPYYFPPVHLVGGNVVGIKSFEGSNGTFDCAHLAVGGIDACGGNEECERHQALMWPQLLPDARSLPSVVDIAALAEAAGWAIIDYPRKFSLASGLWNDPSTWLGDRVPDANDDVYIINEQTTPTVEVFAAGDVRDVFVTSGNNLEVLSSTLEASKVEVAGNGSFLAVEIGATLEAATVELTSDAELFVNVNGLVDLFRLRNFATAGGGGAINVTSLDNSGLIEASGGTLTITDGTLDLDGNDDDQDAELSALMSDLLLVGPVADEVQAVITVGAGRTLTFANGWTQGFSSIGMHRLTLAGGVQPATVAGASELNGRVDVEDRGRFASDVTFRTFADVTLADEDAVLTLEGLTTYRGGDFVGPGAIVERGAVRVEADTTIGPIQLYDMDGADATNVTVLPGATFTLDVFQIEESILDGYDATLSVDGALVVNTDDAWTLDGGALLNFTGGTDGTIAGTELVHRGGLTVDETGHLACSVHIHDTAFIHAFDPGATIELSSAGGNTLLGGRITGDGTLCVTEDSSLVGWGTIDTDVKCLGEMRAGRGQLTINGAITDLGTIGTVDEGDVLFVTSDWSTLDGLLNLRNGSVGGGNIANSGTTTGHGFLFVDRFTNRGRVAPGTSTDGDGADGTGVLAFFGDYAQVAVGELDLVIGGLELGEYDGIAVGLEAQLDGALHLALEPGYLPPLGASIPIVTWTTRAGTFATITGLLLPGGLAWEPEYLADRLRLTVVEGCAGDADGSGAVDFADLLDVLGAWGPCPEPPDPCPADLDRSGVVDFGDVLLVISGWGECE